MIAVLGGVDAVGSRVVPAGDMAEGLGDGRPHRRIGPGDQQLGLQVERRLHQAGVDPAALSGALLTHDRRQDAHGEQRGAMVVDDRRAGRARPRRRLTGDGHHAEQSLGKQVLAGLLGVGAIRAVAGGGRVDQALARAAFSAS